MTSQKAFEKLKHFCGTFAENIDIPTAFINFGDAFHAQSSYQSNEKGVALIIRFKVDDIDLFDIDMYGNLTLYHTRLNIQQFNTIKEFVGIIEHANLEKLVNTIDWENI